MAKKTAKGKTRGKSKTARKSKAKPKPKVKARGKAKARPAPRPKAKAKPKAKPAPKAKAKAKPAPKPKAKAAAKAQPAAAPKAAKPAAKATAIRVAAPKSAGMPGEGLFVRHDLMSTDPERSKTFYGELFGWQLEPVTVQGFSLTRIMMDGQRIGAIMPFDPAHGVASHWVPYIGVADVDGTCKKVGELGGKVCMAGMDIPPGRFALCEFPERALFSPFTPKEPVAPPVPPARHTFCWDELMTTDAAAARAFYGRLFGWTMSEMSMPDGTYILAMKGERQVGGIMQMPSPPAPMWLGYVLVDDVDASTARAQQLGAKVHVVPRDIPNIGRFSVLEDPTGAGIALFRGK